MTRFIIPVFVAFLVSGPSWAETDKLLLLRCEAEKNNSLIVAPKGNSAPKVLFIFYDEKKEGAQVHTGDPLVYPKICQIGTAISQTYEIMKTKYPTWTICTRNAYGDGVFVFEFEINRFTGNMVLEHWPNHTETSGGSGRLPEIYTATQSEKIKYKCVRRQF